MKNLIAFLLFVSTIGFSFSQQLSEKELRKTFAKILRRDQSHIHQDSLRSVLIIENFKQITLLLKENKIPDYKNCGFSKKTEKKIFWGLHMTLHHTLQTQPERLLNELTIHLFKNKTRDNNSLKKVLQSSFWTFNKSKIGYTYPFWNDEFEKMFWFALEEWEIKLGEGVFIE